MIFFDILTKEELINKLNENNLIIDVLILKTGNIKIVDLIGEDLRLNDESYLIYTKCDEFINTSEVLFKYIESEDEVVELSENLNRFPEEIIDLENRNENIDTIIQSMKLQD